MAACQKVEKAKIALINSALEIEKTEFDAKININSPDQMKMFLEEENRMLKSMVDKIIQSGANVVVCQKGIDDIAQHYLASGDTSSQKSQGIRHDKDGKGNWSKGCQ